MEEEDTPKGYKLFKELGKGTFGKVYLTVLENNPELLATKVIDKSGINDKKTLEYLDKEREIMTELKESKHPNIIRLDECIFFENRYCFVMEYCNGGTLSDVLKNYMKKYRKPFTLEIIQNFMRQIVEGLKLIHSKNIIHRDLKLSNILVHFKNNSRKTEMIGFNELNYNDFLNSTIKIIDFGLSKKLQYPDELAKSGVGTPFHMDPKILKKFQEQYAKRSNGTPFNNDPLIIKKYQKAGVYENDLGYSKEVDIWSLGTICYQMLTGDPLFTAETIDDLVIKVEEGDYSIPFDIEICKEIISFLNSMLHYKGDLRPSIEELSHYDFLIKNVKDFTKIDTQKQQEAFITINAIKKSIYINNHKKLENSKEIYKNYLDSLYNDYKEVKQYFQKNNLSEREKKADEKCKQIDNLRKQLNSKINIYLSDLPEKISPEFIYGCSIEERNKKFKQIISRNRAEKNLLEVKLKNIEKKENISVNDKDNYEKNKINYNKLLTVIKILEEQSKNIWVPSPLYTKEIQTQPKEIISYDKSEFKIKFTIKRIDNINDSLNLIIFLEVNQEKKLKKNIELKGQNSNEEWIWILSSEEWMNIDNNINNFILIIKIDKFQIFTNQNPTLISDISYIKNGKGKTFNHQITDNGIKTITISITPILPEGDKSIIMEEKEI